MTTGLSREEVLDLIAQIGDQDAVLIGGQAVALWAQFYHLTPNLPVLSSDIDFLGDSDAAEQASEKLIRYAARLYLPNLDDPTPNSGKITLGLPGHPDPIEIDYLYAITGLDSDDIARRAVTLNLNQHRLKILHPVQCLESKIANLAFYPSKRNPAGIEQARLSILIARAFLADLIRRNRIDDTYALAERIGRFSIRDSTRFAHYRYQLDTLQAIPIEDYPDNPFKTIRFPQIQQKVSEKRQSFQKLMERRQKLSDSSLDEPRFRI